MVSWQPLLQCCTSGPRTRAGRQYFAVWFCWLALHGHVLGSPALNSSERALPDFDSYEYPPPEGAAPGGESGGLQLRGASGGKSGFAGDVGDPPDPPDPLTGSGGVPLGSDGETGSDALERQLQVSPQPYPFFTTVPYANVVIYDSHDENCDRNYDSPPISDPNQAGYPMDGTDVLRKRNMACGVAQARFVFFTSDMSEYEDPTITALVQLRIQARLSLFIESDTCENILDATGNFPRIEGCRFMGHEARVILSTKLRANARYSLTMKMMLPAGSHTAAENSFHFLTELYQVRVIEGTRAPIDLGHTIPNAKDEATYNGVDDTYDKRGYITSFSWQPETGFYTPTPGATTKYTFGIRNFGVLGFRGKTYAIDFIAYPTDVWKLGRPGDECRDYNPSFTGTICDYIKVDGTLASHANGFRIRIGSTPFNNFGSNQKFDMTVTNPMTPVNMYWTATTFRLTSDNLPVEPYTVFLDRPISVLGAAIGRVAHWELASVNKEQWVTLEFSPGNTVQAEKGTISAILVIIPPSDFTIVDSAAPQPDRSVYNALPCVTWPIQDQRAGRWVCTLEDNPLFKETVYRVRLRVINPPTPGAARSWRLEVWQYGAVKPISVTRGIRGMAITGVMSASVAPMNQLLNRDNVLRCDFTPTQDLGKMPETRLKVIAPPGFVVIKRCVGFRRIELPLADCRGLDANGFDLIFQEADAIKANVKYIFEIQVANPTTNVPDYENFWTFETVRPDRVAIDSTRYTGFFLFPYEFMNAQVVPISRRAGVQQIIVRFIAGQRIEFDDYIRIRAPSTVHWNAADLQFDSSNLATDAATVGTRNPTVIFETPNALVFQLTTAAEANIEYGIRANCIVPLETPVPNRWWIEHYRQTGNPAPDNWRYIASSGADGFKTQTLVNAVLQPYNIVAEGWQNPTLVVFETTVAVEPRTKNTAIGVVTVPAEVYLEAPAGFTYICPLTQTVYMPEYTVSVPPNECSVNHNNQAERNQLRLLFSTKIEANVRYAFTIDVVNARYVDLARNNFYLATQIDGVVVEDVTLPGYRLAERMDNTRYWPFPVREDRRVEASGNQVSFVIGTIMRVTQPTILEVKAPQGFRFNLDCTSDVGATSWIPNMGTLPNVDFCQNMERVSIDLANIAAIQMTGTWAIGQYGIYVTVSNPMFTPPRNFWGFTIYDRANVPIMSESWVYGFEIQVVHNPVLFAYNAGNGVDGEAAINRVEVSFSLTTKIRPEPAVQHSLVVTAPVGFRFPNVCRDFATDTGLPDVASLPRDTACRGDGGTRLILTFAPMRSLENSTRYAFRFLVINPRETFTEVNTPRWWWRIETLTGDTTMEDLNRVVPSFAVHPRLGYFQVDTLSRVGLNSTILRFHFRTDGSLPPQQTIHVYPPKGTVFNGVKGGRCREEDPMILSRLFPTPLISGVTRMPEWVSCNVVGPDEVVLQNTEPILGGRPLMSGPVFEFFVKNVTNAEETPALNLFRIMAKTSQPSGMEVWSAEGWVIFPELLRTSVASSNPGYGLYTNFTFVMQPVTPIPAFGSIQVEAPPDYYFGPVIETATSFYDPLQALPPPQGVMEVRPPANQVIGCQALRVPSWTCPFDFQPCLERNHYAELVSIGMPLTTAEITDYRAKNTSCHNMQVTCETGALSTLISCESKASMLTLMLQRDVMIPTRRMFQILVQGYNARNPPVSAEANTWHYVTRDASTERRVMDDKPGVPGLILMGIVRVPSILPSDTKVMSIDNRVKLTIILSTPCEPRAVLRIRYPRAFERNENAAFQGSPVETGPTFPRQVDKRMSVGLIELEAKEETIPADIPMDITVALSNPDILPSKRENIWTFEAFSRATGQDVLLNCNYNITGFKIFAEFSAAHIGGSITAPGYPTVIGVWFVLKSELIITDQSDFRIYLPPGYRPMPVCGEPNRGPGSPDVQVFKLAYDPTRIPNENPFPNNIDFFPMPSGIDCVDDYDPVEDRYFIKLDLAKVVLTAQGVQLTGPNIPRVEDGRDYGFEFGVINPMFDPPAGQNFFRFESRRGGVIQHLRRQVPGYELEKIREVRLTPAFTTSLLTLNRMEFFLMSDKAMSGGSKIRITAPPGFVFTCDYFRTDDGLANTTTCYVSFTTRNIAEFTLDSQDPKAALTPFRLFVTVSNPEFTPRENWWDFELIDPLGQIFDTRMKVPGFDITGQIQAEIRPTFAYLGERNPLDVVFVQTTIMNQNEIGNELVLTAPEGWIFPINCTSNFGIKLTSQRDQLATSSSSALGGAEYPNRFSFPPPGITCQGFNNRTVVLRLPDENGLLLNNYTWRVEVDNPAYQPNGTNIWTFITRVRPPEGGERIVDANIGVRGFTLRALVPVRTDEGAAAPRLLRGTRAALFALCMLGATS